MRILVAHNHYGDYTFGGEAMVVRAEADLLRAQGHEVKTFERTNSELNGLDFFGRIKAIIEIGWSKKSFDAITDEIAAFKPDVLHVHNYKYVLSPSVFAAAKEAGIATILTLHNYRLACPAGQFLYDGKICEDCRDGFCYRMLWRRCSSANPVKNFCQFYLYWTTRRRNLLAPWVDSYIALSEFAKSKFVEAGIPEEKIFVKTNFIEDPDCVQASTVTQTAVVVGRLTKEKGIGSLISAWDAVDFPLSVIGDGELGESLRKQASPSVRFEGALPREKALERVKAASFVVFPSVCYEGCPMTLIEAMALGKPVIATDLGPRRELVKEGYNGFLYNPWDHGDFMEKITMLIEDAELRKEMGRNARKLYLSQFTPQKNYDQMINIYERAVNSYT